MDDEKMTMLINNGFCSTAGVELDAQVPAAHTPGEEKRRVGDRTFRCGLRIRRVQDVRVSGNNVHGCHCVPEPIGE